MMAAVVSSTVSYEEVRRQRLEEHGKRMEELNLLNLSKSLTVASPKPSPGTQLKPRSVRKALDLSAVRKSSRVADKPQPNYKEVYIIRVSDCENGNGADEVANDDAGEDVDMLNQSPEVAEPSQGTRRSKRVKIRSEVA